MEACRRRGPRSWRAFGPPLAAGGRAAAPSPLAAAVLGPPPGGCRGSGPAPRPDAPGGPGGPPGPPRRRSHARPANSGSSAPHAGPHRHKLDPSTDHRPAAAGPSARVRGGQGGHACWRAPLPPPPLPPLHPPLSTPSPGLFDVPLLRHENMSRGGKGGGGAAQLGVLPRHRHRNACPPCPPRTLGFGPVGGGERVQSPGRSGRHDTRLRVRPSSAAGPGGCGPSPRHPPPPLPSRGPNKEGTAAKGPRTALDAFLY